MIIGITGSFGAGKGAVSDYLVQEKGFKHFSARSLITTELERKGLSIDRDSLTIMGNELRAKNGPAYIFEQLVTQAKEHEGDAVVESIRAVAEVHYMKENGGVVLGVDADPAIRYERTTKRGSETDHVSFEEWKAQEIKESNPDDPTKQDVFSALKLSDHVIYNDNNIQALYRGIDAFLETLDKID